MPRPMRCPLMVIVVDRARGMSPVPPAWAKVVVPGGLYSLAEVTR